MCACQKKTKSPTAAQIINFVGGILKFVLVVFSCKLRFRCGNTPPCVADFVGKPQVFHTFLYVYRVNPYPPYSTIKTHSKTPIQPFFLHLWLIYSPPEGAAGSSAPSAPSAPGATNPQMGPGHAPPGGWGWRRVPFHTISSPTDWIIYG